jgi:hypothetical protein
MVKRVVKVSDLSKNDFRVTDSALLVKTGIFSVISGSGSTPIPFNPSLPLDNWIKPSNPKENAVAIVKFLSHIGFYIYSAGNWIFVFSFTHSMSGSISQDVPNYLSLGTDDLPLLSSLGGGGGGSYLITVANTVVGHKIADIFDGDVQTYPINETVTGWTNQGGGVFRYVGESGVTQDLQTNLQLSGDVTTPSAASGVTTISNGAVTESKIGTGAVTSGKIGSGAVTETKIGSGAVSNAKLASDSVTAAKILDATITFAKISQNGATAGQVIQWNGSAWIPVTLALGEANAGLNVGTGADVYKDKDGVNLRFRTLKQGTNINLTENEDEVLFNVPCPCLSNFFQDGSAMRFFAGDCATITKWQRWDSGGAAWATYAPAGSDAVHTTLVDIIGIVFRVEYTTPGGCTLYSNTVTYA